MDACLTPQSSYVARVAPADYQHKRLRVQHIVALHVHVGRLPEPLPEALPFTRDRGCISSVWFCSSIDEAARVADEAKNPFESVGCSS